METSNLFRLNWRDVAQAAIAAAFCGAILPLQAAFQTPGFDIFSANWGAILALALNGGFSGFVTFLFVKLGTDKEGKFGGVI